MLSHAIHLQVSEANWRDPDLSVLDSRRSPVPAVPQAPLPQPWCDWVGDTGRATRALSMSATADETESVLQRLHYLGYVQPDLAHRDKPGWLVNPALAAT